MSTYNYGPPPPPPPQASQAGHSTYAHHSGHYQRHGSSRGGGSSASRGGRGGYQGQGPPRPEYQPPHSQYDYGAHAQQPYASSSYSSSPPTTGGYSTAHHQWPQDHGHPAAQHPQPHAPAPLSSANYHPNYAPQAYAQSQAPVHQPAAYAQPPPPPPPQQQHHYPYHPPAPYSSQQQWVGHDRPQPQYGTGQHRGGYGPDRRGGARALSMGAPPRPDYAAPNVQPQVSGGYPQPYPDTRAVSYPPQPTQYPPYPPPPPAPTHAPARDPYHNKQDGHYAGRNRGGFRGGSNVKGRNSHHHHHGGDKARPRHHQGPRPDGNAGPQKNDANSSGKKKKRKTNTLGLTPGQDSDSEEDDEKEEETLCKLIGQDALQITDVAAYIAERKKNFPTAARIKAKQAAEQANGDKRAAALEKEEKIAMELRKQLEKVESSIKRKREQQDEGDEMRDNSPPSEVKPEGSDEEPEVQSTRSQAQPPAPPAKKADVTKHCKYYSTGGTCGKKGKCRFVHDPQVRETAIKERDANNGQLTIQQRLILNDKDQEDLTVLQSIQYLREKGIVKPLDTGAANGQSTVVVGQSRTQQQQQQQQQQAQAQVTQQTQKAQKTQKTQTQQTRTLPAAPPSLPKPPARKDHGLPPHKPPPSALQAAQSSGPVQYKGWNLSGYGNAGPKSEDLP